MFRAGLCVATGVLATVAAWIGFSHFTLVGAAPAAENRPTTPVAADAKPVDLTALRDAVDSAAKKGENVDEIRKALDAFEKAAPKAAGGVPAELQALRDAVDDAARKGENVEAITKELVAVEMIVAGKSLAKPKTQPRPDPVERPFPQPQPFVPFPVVPFPNPGAIPGGIDVDMFNKAMELRKKALELMMQNRRDPEAQKEAQKLLAEATDLMLKAARGGAGGIAPAFPVMPAFPGFPDIDRAPDRVRLGIRMERVPAVAAEQLGLEPNTGIAVSLVMPGTPAEKAGLKLHDIIIEFAGKPVTDNTEDFARRVSDVKAGEKIDLVVLRKGKKVEVKGVELPEGAKRPAFPQAFPQPLPLPGLQLPGLLPDAPANPRIKPLPPINPGDLPVPQPLPPIPPPILTPPVPNPN